jgi:hypothetical protein
MAMENEVFYVLKHFGIVPGFSSYFCKFDVFGLPEHPRAVPWKSEMP